MILNWGFIRVLLNVRVLSCYLKCMGFHTSNLRCERVHVILNVEVNTCNINVEVHTCNLRFGSSYSSFTFWDFMHVVYNM